MHKASRAINYAGAHRSYQDHSKIGFDHSPLLSEMDRAKVRQAIKLLNLALTEHRKTNLQYQVTESFKLCREVARGNIK